MPKYIEKIKIVDLVFGKYRKLTAGIIFIIVGIVLLSDITITIIDGLEIKLKSEGYWNIIFFILGIIFIVLYVREDKSLYDETSSIKKHPIFIVLRREIPKKFDKEGEFLSIKFKVWHKYLEDITTSKELIKSNYFEEDRGELYTFILKKQEKAIEQYEKEWKKAGFSQETIHNFSQLHNKNLEIIMDYLSIMLSSNFDESTHSKLVTICNAHLFLFDLSRHLIKKSLGDGRLKIIKNQ